jgi:16S rRNA (cytosine967-C5)-methyltransferase
MAGDTRAIAARTLGEVLAGKSLNQLLPPALEKVAERDRGLLQQLCYGTLRQAPRLQALLSELLDKSLRDKDRDVRGLLLCGLYQLEDTRIPDHAAVSATVAATDELNKKWARGMTNAILRRFLRERDQLITGLDEAASLAHPAWLLGALQAQWPEHRQGVVTANNEQPPMTLRVNSLHLSRDEYLGELSQAGIEASPGELSPYSIYLASPRDVKTLPGFEQGLVSVQDEAAQLAAIALGALPGERILDACAAPGGKSCHILELQPQLEELVAMDIDPLRLSRVAENLDRLQLSAELLEGDGAKPPGTLQLASFDRILVDAPCSATGVIRRHPDVKVLRREKDIAKFSLQQLEILSGLWPLLKPGGCLLYATCSVLSAENTGVVRQHLQRHPDAESLDLQQDWGESTAVGRQVLPASSGPDGLFYAMLRKRPH